MNPVTRRDLLRAGAASAALPLLPGAARAADPVPSRDPWHGLKIGVASYTFRKFPVDRTIHVQHLEHDLQAGAVELHQRFERGQ